MHIQAIRNGRTSRSCHPTHPVQYKVCSPLWRSFSISRSGDIDGGVLIDMSDFNQVSYDESGQVATLGSGLTWGEVYSQLDPFGVIVVGGRVSDVGVSGLTLGGIAPANLCWLLILQTITNKIFKGSLSYLSDLYGLVCDNVVNSEV